MNDITYIENHVTPKVAKEFTFDKTIEAGGVMVSDEVDKLGEVELIKTDQKN